MQRLHTSDAASAASVSVLEKTDDLISALQLVRGSFAAGNVAANAPAATGREPTSDEQAAPGLLDLIMQYRLGKEQFGELAPSEGDPPDSLAAETYGPAMEAICRWQGMAEDEQAARAALTLALEEFELGEHETAHALMKAANAYFRRDLHGVSLERLRPEDIWKIDDCVTQVDGILCLALRTLSVAGDGISDGLSAKDLISDIAAMERVFHLARERLEFASDRLSEISVAVAHQKRFGC